MSAPLSQDVRDRLPALGGTYVLILESRVDTEVEIGRLGRMVLQQGFYLYVGSAFGPGGLWARVGRHVKKNKPQRWHIDYLRPHLRLETICYSTDPERYEDTWSERITGWPAVEIPMPGFGASDSHAVTHLFYFQMRPKKDLYRGLEGRVIKLMSDEPSWE